MGDRQIQGKLNEMDVPAFYWEGGELAYPNAEARDWWDLSAGGVKINDIFPTKTIDELREAYQGGRLAHLQAVTVWERPFEVFLTPADSGSLLLLVPMPVALKSDRMALASDFGHIVRQPLTLILSAIHLLGAQIGGTEKTDRYLETALQGCFQLLRVSNNMEALPKYLAGEADFIPVQRNLIPFAREVMQSAVPFADTRDIVMQFQVQGVHDSILASFDERKLERALLNLLSNALKATEPGGQITMTIGQNEGTVFIRLADSGRGIEPERLVRLFSPSNTQATGENAIGMGLLLTRAIVALHGGTLMAESRVGIGTTITLTLPSRPQAPDILRTRPLTYDYAGEFPHALVELSDAVSGAHALYATVLRVPMIGANAEASDESGI